MKIHRKIGIGLVLITALLAGLFFSHSSSAAPSFSAAWIDRSNIQVTGEGKTVVLTDGKWDAEWKYEGTLDSCVASLIGGSLIDGFDGDLIVGFSDNSGNTNPSAWNDSVSRAGNFRVYYNTTPTYNSCTWFSADTVHINDSPNAQLSYRWTDNGHGAIARVDDGSKWTFSKPVKIPSGFDSGKTRFFRDSETGKACQDLIDVSPDGGTMWLYEQVRKGEGGSSGVTSPPDPNCNLKATINDLEVGSATVDQWHQNIPSNYPLPLGEFFSPGDSGDGGVTGTDDACYSSGWQLSWIACPVITAAQTAANSMYGFVEDQLKFTVLQYCPPTSSNPNPDCADSLGEQHNSVHSAWNNIRILVSSLVVILLLVMVIAQAIGSGPLDAYTVRKMLPRLVAGVILIQVSWPVFSWVVNTVDHLGVGLADIMYAPFGGSKALDLNTIMQPFTNSVAGGAKVIAFNYASIGALAIFGVASPFVVLGLILTVMVAIFVGFLTLLFRKILIILALIFVPIALISWMMPNDGLRKYWKLWWDNFSKALMMFPLIIAMIAGGRIFAKIGSGQSDFVGFFIVLVGFFGPLFILPKTFKWGGTLMQTASNAMTKAQTTALKKPMESLKGFNERYQGKRADMYTPLETGKKGQFWRGARRIQSGHFVPFSKRSRNLTLQSGAKWAQDQNDLADAYLKKWVDKAEGGDVTPEMVDHYNDMAREMGYTGGDLLNYDTFKDGGIGAAKWSTLPLMMDATRRGDDRIQKAIMRYLPHTKSLLEFANDKFMMPAEPKAGGGYEWVPSFDHPVMIDQAAKNSDIYDAMIGMRSGLLASHNTPHGGANYGDVYKKRLLQIPDPAGPPGAMIPNPDYDTRYATEFAGGPGSRPYLAQQMQEISEDSLSVAAGGGNRAITFHKNIRSWADTPTGRYEDGASSILPAEKLAEVYVEASRSQAGRQKLQGLLDSPTTQAEVDAALTRSGHTQFRDALGDLHDLTIRDLLESGERADQKISSGAAPVPAPGVRPPLF
ncbi:MAG: hypothetical protein AAB541_00615 [Patescibacteria group bacterium]